jgi:Transposase, Mutator family
VAGENARATRWTRKRLATSASGHDPSRRQPSLPCWATTSFPISHWKKVWSTNPLERLNKEVKRRTWFASDPKIPR